MNVCKRAHVRRIFKSHDIECRFGRRRYYCDSMKLYVYIIADKTVQIEASSLFVRFIIKETPALINACTIYLIRVCFLFNLKLI